MNFDFGILYEIQENFQSEFLDTVMPVITRLGSGGIIWIVSAFVLICFKKYRKCGADMLIGMLIGLIIGNLIIKNLVARERPCWIDTAFNMLITVPKDYSFPSGHTLSSVISSAVIMRKSRILGIFSAVTALLIAFSRMYLFVHFPTDILGGIILGLIIGISTPVITSKFILYRKSHIKKEMQKNP